MSLLWLRILNRQAPIPTATAVKANQVFAFLCSGDLRDLHSSPTPRSSDLTQCVPMWPSVLYTPGYVPVCQCCPTLPSVCQCGPIGSTHVCTPVNRPDLVCYLVRDNVVLSTVHLWQRTTLPLSPRPNLALPFCFLVSKTSAHVS